MTKSADLVEEFNEFFMEVEKKHYQRAYAGGGGNLKKS